MQECAVKKYWEEKRYCHRDIIDKDYNVKLSIDKFKSTYQLRIKNKTPNSMSLLIDNHSDIVSRLKVKERLNLIYYPKDTPYPRFNLGTMIRHITKCDQTEAKNYFLIGLEILKGKN